MERGLAFAASRFPESTVKVRNTTIQFQVAKEPPSVIFGHILANRHSLGIQDFAVKHTTLDEVSKEIIEIIGNYFYVNKIYKPFFVFLKKVVDIHDFF